MTRSDSLTDQLAARYAIEELINQWARCADRRLPRQQAELFIEDCTVTVYTGDPATTQPAQVIRGRHHLEESLAVLNTYDHTTHFNGQAILAIDGNTAQGETYCLAHHLSTTDQVRTMTVMAIRYLDTFVHENDRWAIAQRTLIIDWTETRPSNA